MCVSNVSCLKKAIFDFSWAIIADKRRDTEARARIRYDQDGKILYSTGQSLVTTRRAMITKHWKKMSALHTRNYKNNGG